MRKRYLIPLTLLTLTRHSTVSVSPSMRPWTETHIFEVNERRLFVVRNFTHISRVNQLREEFIFAKASVALDTGETVVAQLEWHYSIYVRTIWKTYSFASLFFFFAQDSNVGFVLYSPVHRFRLPITLEIGVQIRLVAGTSAGLFRDYELPTKIMCTKL